MTYETFYFLDDEVVELLSNVEVDGIDLNIHIILLFFVHGDVQVDNFVEVPGKLYVYKLVWRRAKSVRAAAGRR